MKEREWIVRKRRKESEEKSDLVRDWEWVSEWEKWKKIKLRVHSSFHWNRRHVVQLAFCFLCETGKKGSENCHRSRVRTSLNPHLTRQWISAVFVANQRPPVSVTRCVWHWKPAVCVSKPQPHTAVASPVSVNLTVQRDHVISSPASWVPF